MSPQVAVVACFIGIAGLFWLDRDRTIRTSKSLWLPVIWLLLAGSRSVSQWLQVWRSGPSGQPLDLSPMEGNPVDRFVYTGLVAAGLLVLASRKRVLRVVRANAAITLFFLYCVASIVWSDFPDIAFKRLIKAFGDLLMVLIVLTERDRVGAIKRFLARCAFVLIPVSVLFMKYFPDLGRGFLAWEWTSFYTGITTNKNALGMISMLFGLASLWRLADTWSARGRLIVDRHVAAHSVIGVMAAWICRVSNSITSLGCMLLAGSLLMALSLRKVARRTVVVHIIVAGVVLIPFSTLFLGVGSDVAGEATGRNIKTLTSRTELWRDTIRFGGNPLIGTGFASYWLGSRLAKLWQLYWWRPTEAHDGYLEIYLNLGWIGIGFLTAVLVTGYRNATSALRRRLPEGNLMVALFAMGLMYNFTEAAIVTMMSPAWIMLLLSITKVPVFGSATALSRPGGGRDSISDRLPNTSSPKRVDA